MRKILLVLCLLIGYITGLCAGDQCYLAEFNGVTEDPSVANFSDGTAESPKAYDFQGWAIKGSFTFTARTAQTCLWVKITTTTDKVLKFEKDAYSFDLTDLTANGHMPEPIANTTGSTVTYVGRRYFLVNLSSPANYLRARTIFN